LFDSYADHPRRSMWLPSICTWSMAAGRYQILPRYFDVYKRTLGLPDFGHDSQDAIAVQMIHECDALSLITGGAIAAAVQACSSRWASLPGATYGQHTNQLPALLAAFTSAGGDVA
jgi:muramidase (phage lysozyme)